MLELMAGLAAVGAGDAGRFFGDAWGAGVGELAGMMGGMGVVGDIIGGALREETGTTRAGPVDWGEVSGGEMGGGWLMTGRGATVGGFVAASSRGGGLGLVAGGGTAPRAGEVAGLETDAASTTGGRGGAGKRERLGAGGMG